MPRPTRNCANSPAKEKVPCPVCGRLFGSTIMNGHLDKCLSAPSRKRSRPDSDSEDELQIAELEPTPAPSPKKPAQAKPKATKKSPVKLSPSPSKTTTKPATTKPATAVKKSTGKLNEEWAKILKNPTTKKEKDPSKPPKKKTKKSTKKDSSSSGSTDDTSGSKKTKSEKGEKKKKRKKKLKDKKNEDVFSFDGDDEPAKAKVKGSSKGTTPKAFSPSKTKTLNDKHASATSPKSSSSSFSPSPQKSSVKATPISGVSPVGKGANWTFGGRSNLPTASPNAHLVKPSVQTPPPSKPGSQTPLSAKSLGQSPLMGKANVPPSTQPRPDFRPLAEKMRPYTMDTLIGQTKALGVTCTLRRLLDSGNIPSMIFWGPPGCGKTSLANVIARQAKVRNTHRFITLSATTSNVADVKSAVEIARNEQRMSRRKTILFIDEIHRFNKTQQDAFLLHVENGTIILIGATTENPSFRVNSALLSRCRVVVLEKLSPGSIMKIIERAIKDSQVTINEDPLDDTPEDQASKNKGNGVSIERSALYLLANLCDGDARSALNSLEMVLDVAKGTSSSSTPSSGQQQGSSGQMSHVITSEEIKDCMQRTHISYDKTGEEHFNCTSAFQKSIRGSDTNAALYWLGRMLIGGEDPMYVARRLVVIASEDIGIADSQALVQAVATYQSCQSIGMPECELSLAHCAIYLAKAPKSRQVPTAYARVKECIQTTQGPTPPIPLHLQMPATQYQLVKNTLGGWGKGRQIAGGYQGFLPESLASRDFFS